MPIKNYLTSKLVPLLRTIPGLFEAVDQTFVIETVVGQLVIRIFDDWVACRFLDVEKAKTKFTISSCAGGRLNHFSGKWNWHWFDVAPYDAPKVYKFATAAHLDLLAEVVWREIEDLTPEAVAKSKEISAGT